MTLSNKDRDNLLVDILQGIAYITSEVETVKNARSSVLFDKVQEYKSKLLQEEELPTSVGNGIYDIGDYVVINVGNNICKGRITGRINYDQHPGYTVQNLVDQYEVWVVKEKDISQRIQSSLPPPPVTTKDIPAAPRVPIVQPKVKKLPKIPKPPPKQSSFPPVSIDRSKVAIPPPPPIESDIDELMRESKLWAQEAKQKTKEIEDLDSKDLETVVK